MKQKNAIPNTFGLEVQAAKVVTASTPQQLQQFWQQAKTKQQPVLILGSGSNTLFTADFDGVVIINGIGGIHSTETEEAYLIRVGAGVLWHDLVQKTLAAGQPGLENLALIPGTVGSAPIQNIGAYGVEFKQFAHYVEIVHLATGKRQIIYDGQYGYRDSIFKHKYRNDVAILYVGLRLPKKWQPALEYGDLRTLAGKAPTADCIFRFVCSVRQQKLPDPTIVGNGGSFFKNPIISNEVYARIKHKHGPIPCYEVDEDRVKLAAGWLIEQAGLKGFVLGEAAVHDKQALVIINKGHANSAAIIALASLIRHRVRCCFGVELVPEIRFIGCEGEIDPVKVLDNWNRKEMKCQH